jgi:hypothetical protein
MASLYAIQYSGQTGVGAGALYVGNGVIVGFDMSGGRYDGTYKDNGDYINGAISLSVPGGGALVTGDNLPAGASIQIPVDWPADLGNGEPMQLKIGERTVQVVLTKMADVP